MNVNPTRMELKKLKGRLKTAQRGHKLLKDKTDEMIRRFSVLVRETARLRAEVESEVADVLRMFSLARGTMSDKEIELAFSMPVAALSLECVTVNLLNLEIPKLHLQRTQSEESYPYSFAEVTSEADHAVASAGRLVERLLRLAELEKATTMLSDEIERSTVDNGVAWFPQDILKYLSAHDFDVSMSQLPTIESQFVEFVSNELREGRLLIICLNMKYVSLDNSGKDNNRVNKFYPGEIGHFLVVKGYKTVDGVVWMEVNDPWGLDLKYADGTYKGNNRYYRAGELAVATANHQTNVVVVNR